MGIFLNMIYEAILDPHNAISETFCVHTTFERRRKTFAIQSQHEVNKSGAIIIINDFPIDRFYM